MGLLRPDLGPVLAVVATVLRRLPLRLLVRSLVRDVAPRADHTTAAPASTRPARPGPGADAERRPSSQVRIGKDFPDQRGHGPLVRGGHRGSTSR